MTLPALVPAIEANFDGLVGPTHNYAGLAQGNVASAKNATLPSNPREAALQGLGKMRALAAMGMAQGVLPPQERPHIPTLKALGFSGKDAEVLAKAAREAPGLLAAVSSASSMWTANAATASPGADCADGRVHFTPANLASHLHRSLEPATTARALAATFADARHFAHHAPLPATPAMGDEGAANHTRLCADYGAAGLEFFVYGLGSDAEPKPEKYPARQTRAASEAVARLHGLDAARTVYHQQQPSAIDAGVFHNDVIAVGNRELLFFHEQAFVDAAGLKQQLQAALPAVRFVEVAARDASVADAVSSYLFNSQLLCLPGTSGHTLVVAQECAENKKVWACIQRLVAEPGCPINDVKVFDLRQSMHNGGGPACLRLRVVLSEAQRAAVNAQSWITPEKADALEAWVKQHYRDRLVFADLADPALLDESRTALDRLTQLLGLGSIYDFQR
ncbi:MAG: N-succinylarginine dihydrolase [Pseudomonadota bacterium]